MKKKLFNKAGSSQIKDAGIMLMGVGVLLFFGCAISFILIQIALEIVIVATFILVAVGVLLWYFQELFLEKYDCEYNMAAEIDPEKYSTLKFLILSILASITLTIGALGVLLLPPFGAFPPGSYSLPPMIAVFVPGGLCLLVSIGWLVFHYYKKTPRKRVS